jgi:DNA-binding NarL/FixJ family response regulator
VRVSILDDHQSIIDGYLYRLSQYPEIEVVGTALTGEELEPLLANNPTDVLLLDITVPTSRSNPNAYPILHLIPKLLERYPALNILVVSMHKTPTMIKSVMEAGASGYILKDDQETIQNLANAVCLTARGGIFLSQPAYEQLHKRLPQDNMLTTRQLEAISLCAAYPDATSTELASRLGVANSTVRNLLSGAYVRLDVHTRAAAIAKAQKLGLISTPFDPIEPSP